MNSEQTLFNDTLEETYTRNTEHTCGHTNNAQTCAYAHISTYISNT